MEHWYSWTWSSGATKFEAIAQDVQRILAESTLAFTGPDYAGSSVYSSGEIAFAPDQGAGGDGPGTAFALLNGRRGLCETYDDSYAEVIMAVLIRAAVHLPQLHILSDCEWETDWASARQHVDAMFGESPAHIALNESDLEQPVAPVWVQFADADPAGMNPAIATIVELEIAERTVKYDEGVPEWQSSIGGVSQFAVEAVIGQYAQALPVDDFNVDIQRSQHPIHGYELTTVSARRDHDAVRAVVMDRSAAAKHVPYAYRALRGNSVVFLTYTQSLRR